MPEKITREDGTEVEVYLSSEVEELKGQAEKVKDLDEIKTKLAEAEQLLSETTPEGLKNVRDAYKRAKAALKAQGIETDDQGNPIPKVSSISQEEVQRIAQEEAKKLAVQNIFDASIAGYDTEVQQVIRHRYEKLTAGEAVTLQNIQEHISVALSAAGVQSQRPVIARAPSFSGGEPRMDDPSKKRFSDTEAGKEKAKMLFGDDSLI